MGSGGLGPAGPAHGLPGSPPRATTVSCALWGTGVSEAAAAPLAHGAPQPQRDRSPAVAVETPLPAAVGREGPGGFGAWPGLPGTRRRHRLEAPHGDPEDARQGALLLALPHRDLDVWSAQTRAHLALPARWHRLATALRGRKQTQVPPSQGRQGPPPRHFLRLQRDRWDQGGRSCVAGLRCLGAARPC